MLGFLYSRAKLFDFGNVLGHVPPVDMIPFSFLTIFCYTSVKSCVLRGVGLPAASFCVAVFTNPPYFSSLILTQVAAWSFCRFSCLYAS